MTACAAAYRATCAVARKRKPACKSDTQVSLECIIWPHFCIAHVIIVYASDLLAKKMATETVVRLLQVESYDVEVVLL